MTATHTGAYAESAPTAMPVDGAPGQSGHAQPRHHDIDDRRSGTPIAGDLSGSP
jgi:hypothetical protein